GGAPRRDAVRAAFARVGGAAVDDAWPRVSAALDRYTAAWTRMSVDSCEATHVRGEQSAAVLDLRTSCLGAGLQRLRALTDVLAAADRGVVREAVAAVDALPDVAACADVEALKAVTPLPSDPAARARDEALRRRVAEANALKDTGKMAEAEPLARALVVDARAAGYDPTLAEAAMLNCWLEDHSGRWAAAAALCEEALWAAEASRDDDVGATAAAQLAGLSVARRDDSARWTRLARAIVKRMGPGHDRVAGWIAHNEANAALEMGDAKAARGLYERAIAIKTAALGPEHPDVAVSLNSYGNTLHELGADEDGLKALARAAAIFERAYGPGNRFVAMALQNEGEILDATDRPREALPLPVGESRFALARALWDAGGDRRRARALAEAAREAYGRATNAQKEIAGIDAWLASHRV
ncbi:MAG TPA: tetratricopeptide repeat protein, partial [Polyangia bacterium]|nr:tetratricopeptide repeat protein [Polyangia bacterium]